MNPHSHTARAMTLMDQLLSCSHLIVISTRRLIRPGQTIACVLFLGIASLGVGVWASRERTAAEFSQDILLPIFFAFLLPLYCLCYATAAIASEREDQTLVYLLVTPLPRAFVYVAKYFAALIVVAFWILITIIVLSALAGSVAWEPFRRFWPTILLTALAYIGLFQLFSVMLRRATIVGLLYALFLEGLLGNMPGTVKRIAISYYARCMIFDFGTDYHLGPRRPELFLPISGELALVIMCLLAAAFFVGGMVVFLRREYV